MKNILNILFYLITWIIFPPLFIFLLVRNKQLKKKIKIYGYFSIIISPFTILLAIMISIYAMIYQPSKFSLEKLEDSIGISLPSGYSTEKNSIEYLGQDYEAEVKLIFTDKGLNKVINNIEQTKYFNLQNSFYGSNKIEWVKSDTALYQSVRDYLETEHLTGYWIKTDSVTYEFYEPRLSDIPNSAILFHEGYFILATINTSEKKLVYKYIKL